MIKKIILLHGIQLIFINFSTSNAIADCDCKSMDSLNPCTGQSITVTVAAGTPNGGTPINNVYSWYFNSGGGDAFCGQFANGDYWVAPASGKSSVTITGITSSSHPDLLKADANPNVESVGLLSSSKTYYNYIDTENITKLLPHSYGETTSIVAAIQRDETREGNCGTSSIVGSCADSYNILTVMKYVPQNAGATVIRPNITGVTKEILTWDDFDLSKLPSLSYIPGSDSSKFTEIKKRWSHSTEIFALRSSALPGYSSEGGRAWRSHILIDDYGAGYANSLNNDIISLFSSSNTLEEKKPALASILAFANDIYHSKYDPPTGSTRYWGSGAGQHPGRFVGPAILASLLKDQTKMVTLKQSASLAYATSYAGPQEIQQKTTGANGPVYGDYDDTVGGYWNEMLKSQCFSGGANDGLSCPYVTGKRTGRDPYGYIDGPGMIPGGGYMPISLASQKSLVGIMFMMPGVCEAVNDDSLIEFVDRTISHGIQAGNDPCASPDTRENPSTCDAYRNQGCVYYGVTWGPDPANLGQCIKTATPPYTQIGRFSSKDGATMTSTLSYTASQVSSNWSKIRESGTSCRVKVPIPSPNIMTILPISGVSQ